MEAIILSGLQASGKSTFYATRFLHTHVRLNLDMLHTRTREDILLHACLAAKQPFVVDNTNPTREKRARYRQLATAAGFRTTLYYFPPDLDACLQRNAPRPGKAAIPAQALHATAARLEPPSADELFDQVFIVRITPDANTFPNPFIVQEWHPT